jgi:uncharacterized protein
MRIGHVVCLEVIAEKLAVKHHVTVREAYEILLGQPRIRFVEKGHTEGDDVYSAFGQTFEGRYLAVFFVYKRGTTTAIIISARDMSDKERRAYGRK